ncbi:50S ribosomal protein L29 [Blattabacterium sp. (Blaberus giganteus)]|uniref:50S ribosomal protein L29 n=1 Tax=Blattabacterium sp. (Blaberus giganteus) TaxID=1186051 RepID=UPI00025F6F85|nr:50S ribosomal protein L29 [Blattabacterium sp. (Blaberus giganteus)]AFJ90820.1 50S ribosomal protein L29 [Blattabacterium sp. (Blaberus giganteus)]
MNVNNSDINIKNLSVHDLIKQIDKNQKNYQNLKFRHHIKILKNPMEIRFIRRNIAKLKTEYNKKIDDRRI